MDQADTDFAAALTALRHDFHRHPELGFHQTRTKAIVAGQSGLPSI